MAAVHSAQTTGSGTIPSTPMPGGSFNALGGKDYYLGDFLGLAMADNAAYAAWTDTRTGNQDVLTASFAIRPAPIPLNDRFEPNDTSASPTELGRIVQRMIPELAVKPGDEDWYRVQAAATGDLIVSATQAGASATEALRLELWSETAATLLANGTPSRDAAGNVIGQDLHFPATSGQPFLLRVRHAEAGGESTVGYSLRLKSLTADLGTRAYAHAGGSIDPRGGALYRVTAAATGSMEVQIASGDDIQGKLNLQILDPETFAVLASGQPPGVSLAASCVEPNDSIGKANVTGLDISGSVTLEGVIGDGDFGGTGGDYDFFRFDAADGQKITATLDAAPLASQLDSMLVLYDGSGTALASRDGAGSGGKESLTWVTDAAEAYYVAVLGWESGIPADPFLGGTGAGAGSKGAYRLSIASERVGPGAIQQAGLPVQKGQRPCCLSPGRAILAGPTLWT